MPSLVGELLVGMVMGPQLLALVPIPDAMMVFGEVGLILLVVEARLFYRATQHSTNRVCLFHGTAHWRVRVWHFDHPLLSPAEPLEAQDGPAFFIEQHGPSTAHPRTNDLALEPSRRAQAPIDVLHTLARRLRDARAAHTCDCT